MKKIISIMLSLVLVCTLFTMLTACGSTETVEEETQATVPYEYEESLTVVNNTTADVLNYFNSLVEGVRRDMPAISYRIEKNIPNDSLKVTKTGEEDAEEMDEAYKAINDAAKGIKDLILEDIKKESGDISYGEDNTEMIFVKGEEWASKLSVSDIESASIKEVGDCYYITINFADLTGKEAGEALNKAFNLRDKDEILASEEFKKTADYLKLNDYDVVYSGCRITATVNRFTNEITNLNYLKSSCVTAFMTGINTLESYGDVSVMFTLEDNANYDITWENPNPTSPLETTEASK